MIRRLLSTCLALMLLFALSVPVRAETRAVKAPYRPTMPAGRYDFLIPNRQPRAASKGLQTVTEPALGSEGVWRATAQAEKYAFQLCNVAEVTDSTIYLETVFDGQTSDDTTFRYTFYEPGTYYLYCTLTQSDGTQTQAVCSFEIEYTDGADCVADRVSAIVTECRAQVSGDYETALWLHDWITTHAYYDLTCRYHGADSILYYGTGVCDSYSKLYRLLLEAAGIECRRVTGTAGGGGHAWNAVCLNGQWCQVDPTWDDPAGDDVPVSGSETHDYFGLNDALMQLDHTYTPDVACTTLEYSAAGREERYRVWLWHIWTDIEDAFAEGNPSFSIDTQGIIVAKVFDDGSYSYYNDANVVDYYTTVAAALMESTTWTWPGDHAIRATFAYEASGQTFDGEVRMENVSVALPETLVQVDASAFEGDEAIQGVIIPGPAVIESGAFANCANLLWVVIESADTVIMPGAFGENTEGLIIVCPADSRAEAFAQQYGIIVREVS